jgi:hypothetical protein
MPPNAMKPNVTIKPTTTEKAISILCSSGRRDKIRKGGLLMGWG